MIAYGSPRNFVDTDGSIHQRIVGPSSHNVDSSERLIFNVTGSGQIQYLLFDLDTTLGELQQTINNDHATISHNQFRYNFTSLTSQNSITNIYLAIFDDDVTTNIRLGAGTAVPLIEFGNPQGSYNFLNPLYLHDTALADKKIGYIIEFNSPVSVTSGTYPISLDFSSFRLDRTPINQITRTYDYSIQIPSGLTPAQQITYQNLVNVIAARQTAIDQQTIIVDYWSDSNNPFADDRTLAQARIDYANNHITQSTIQRDSYQAQLDQLTS